MAEFEVVYYRRESGESPFQGWFDSLDNVAAGKMYSALLRMEAGNFSDSRRLQGGISERRVHSGPGYRIYYAIFRQRYVVLLGGGTKRTQVDDIRRARQAWHDFKKRAD